MSQTIEVVTFKLNENASKADFLAANPGVQNWIASQPGFEYRALSQKEDGSWVDTVFWDSMENAQKAGAAFCQAAETKPLMAFIDENTVTMEHLSVASAICATEVSKAEMA